MVICCGMGDTWGIDAACGNGGNCEPSLRGLEMMGDVGCGDPLDNVAVLTVDEMMGLGVSLCGRYGPR